MALYHLSGDDSEFGKSKAKKEARKEKKAGKKSGRKEKRAKKKAEGKGAGRKIAKVGLAPARAAFLTVVTLNVLKCATKLARVWNKPGGQSKLNTAWAKLGGKTDKLKNAIAKGSKQKISGDEMGAVTETLIATATPIIIIMAKLIKEFKAGGDDEEKADFDKGVDEGVKTLAKSDEFEKGNATMPEGADVAALKGEGAEKEKGEGETKEGNLFSPVGFCFKTLLMLGFVHIENPFLLFLVTILTLYCLIGFFVIAPVMTFDILGFGSRAKIYFVAPFNFIKNIFHGKK